MRNHIRPAIAVLAAALLLAGCGTATPSATGHVGPTGSPAASATTSLAERLRDAPEVLTLGDREYEVRASLTGGAALVATIEVLERNGQPIPADLKLDYLWVINDSDVWATAFGQEPLPTLLPSQIMGIARNGPSWEANIQVDVVVALRQGDGPQQLLRASGQTIQAAL